MKTILLILLILIMPSVLAGNENGYIVSGGNLFITDVDVVVDGKTSRNLEYGDEISKVAYPNSIIEFQVEIFNNHTSLVMEDVEMIVAIDDLDIEESANSENINNINDKKMTVEVIVPSDIDGGDYDVLIEIEGKQNATIHEVRYVLELVVEEDEEVEETISMSLYQHIRTMNQSLNEKLNDIESDIGSYFEPYQTCTQEKSDLQIEVNTCNSEKERLSPMEAELQACQAEKLTLATQRDDLRFRYNNCTASIETIYKPEVQQTKSNYLLWGLIIVAIGVGLWYNRDKLRKPKAEVEEELPQ